MMKEDLLSEQTLRADLCRDVATQVDNTKVLSSEVEKIQVQLHGIQQICKTLEEKCELGRTKVEEDLKEIDVCAQQDSLQDIANKLTEIDLKYNEFEEKLKSGFPETSLGSNLDSEEVKQGIAKIDQLESTSAVLSANLSDLELKLQLLENTCYEGQQLWKVDNVVYRTNQALTGKVTALHSAPCFQKRGGYKFCSR